jgi:hypothetical protein
MSNRFRKPSFNIVAVTCSNRGLSLMPMRIQRTSSAGNMPSQYIACQPHSGTTLSAMSEHSM